jgi:hypothetical protein
VKFNALRDAMDKAIDGPAEPRKDAARKLVADNAVFNAAATKLLDEQVRRMAQLDGDAYRQAIYANIAWNCATSAVTTPASTRTSLAPIAPPPKRKKWSIRARRAVPTRSRCRCWNCAATRQRLPTWQLRWRR